MKPLCIDLFCGLGGWAEGFLAEGFRVVGFDIERHRYPARLAKEESSVKVGGIDFNGYGKPGYKAVAFNGTAEKRLGPITGGWQEYPGHLVIQDVLTIHGSQFKDAAVIVASPPCQNYSYLAMPWSRSTNPDNSKAAKALRLKWETEGPDNRLFDACFRIQREAIEAAGRYIPLIVENVRGAQPWVGRSAWNYGSFHLWGDVPALMPINLSRGAKVPGFRFDGSGRSFQTASVIETAKSAKESGGWFNDYKGEHCVGISRTGSRSSARKAASAQIAVIPFALASHIAQVFYPRRAIL